MCKKEIEKNNLKNILDFAKRIPITAKNVGIGLNNPESMFQNKIIKLSTNDKDDILSTSHYGGIDLVSSIQKNNIFGTQFHPEKSQSNGTKLIDKFINWTP